MAVGSLEPVIGASLCSGKWAAGQGILVVPFHCTISRCFWKSRMRIRLVRGGRPLIRTFFHKFGKPIYPFTDGMSFHVPSR